jgi:hypothetical protein
MPRTESRWPTFWRNTEQATEIPIFIFFSGLADTSSIALNDAGATDALVSDVVFGGKFRLASNNYTVILAGRFVSVEVFQGCEKAPAVLADKFVFAMLEGLKFPPVTPRLGPVAWAKEMVTYRSSDM